MGLVHSSLTLGKQCQHSLLVNPMSVQGPDYGCVHAGF